MKPGDTVIWHSYRGQPIPAMLLRIKEPKSGRDLEFQKAEIKFDCGKTRWVYVKSLVLRRPHDLH